MDIGYAEERYKDGLECANKATFYDQQGQYSAAITFYSEAAEALNQACDLAPMFNPILPRVEEYMKRSFMIREYLKDGRNGNTVLSVYCVSIVSFRCSKETNI